MGLRSILVMDHTALGDETRRKWREVESHGFQVHILCPDRWIENFRQVRATEAGAPRGGLTLGEVFWPGKENRAFYRSRAQEAFRQAKPELVITMSERFSFFTAQCALLAATSRPRIPFVFYAWDNLSTRSWVPYRPSAVYRALGRLAGSRAAGAMVANRDAAAVLRRCGFRRPIWHVPYCIEVVADLRQRRNRDYRSLRVGFLGRLIHAKGVDVLLGALALIGNRNAVTAAIAGDGPEKLRLHQMVGDLGIDGIVRFDGHIERTSIPDWFAGIDVIVLPSRTTHRWKEQFGRVLVEAMAAGVVPVGSDSGAIPEVIGEAGIVVPQDQPSALAEAIVALARDVSRRDELAERARVRALREYSPAVFGERVASVLRAVLQS